VLDEIRRIALVGVAHAPGRENRHRDLGQIVEDEEVDLTALDQLGRRGRGIAPECRGAADTQ
jgi:hypothetical protein